MKIKSHLMVMLILVGAAISSAHCKPEDQQCLTYFVQSFPKLDELKSSLTAYLNSQPPAVQSASGGNSSPVSDSSSTLDSLVLHNLKFHMDTGYGDTLQRSQQNGSQTLTPFQLAEKWQHNVSLTYEVTLDQFTGARRQSRAALEAQKQSQRQAEQKAQWDRAAQAQAALAQLENDYLKLEQLQSAMVAAFRATALIPILPSISLRRRP